MSLFKRPAWAKTQASDHDDNERSFFSHASRSYQEIVVEEQRKKRERLERQKAKEERKERRSSAKREVKPEDDVTRSSKRRRITLEEGSDLLKEVGLSRGLSPAEIQHDHPEDSVSEYGSGDASPRRSPRAEMIANRDRMRSQGLEQPRSPAIIEIDGNSADEAGVEAIPPPAADEADEDSDDDLADLRRQARARRDLAQEAQGRTPGAAAMSPTPPSDVGRLGIPPGASLPDPPVQLFISSPIPGAKPMIVQRKLWQNLGLVREVWCSKQVLPQGVTSDDVFLVYRMRKVYDVTTCRSLGFFGSAKADFDETDEHADKIHLQAVTAVEFAQLKFRRSADDEAQAAAAAAEAEAQAAAKAEPTLRLVLKAKGHNDFRLRVKPVSTKARVLMFRAIADRNRIDDDD